MENTLSELTALWGRVLNRIKAELADDPLVYDSFFKDSYIHSLDGKTINVVVNSSLAVQILRSQYEKTVLGALADCTETNFDVHFLSKDQISSSTAIKPARASPAKGSVP